MTLDVMNESFMTFGGAHDGDPVRRSVRAAMSEG